MNDEGFGQPVLRKEDARLLMGKGRFTADLHAEGQVRGYVLRSPHAHADIRGIDAAAARHAPGVLAVLTAEDVATDGLGAFVDDQSPENFDGAAAPSPPWPILARGRVRHVGEAVAFIVAGTESAARDAAELIDVDYDPLPAVSDVTDAAAAGAPRLWPEAPGNIAAETRTGDAAAAERAFASAAHVTRLELVDNRVVVAQTEPPAALGEYDADAGRYTLHVPSQGVHVIREFIARDVLKIPEDELRVVTGDVGGGFGLRTFPTPEHVLVLWAARRVGRPVKWVGERGDAMASDFHARDKVTSAELALDADHRILAVRVDTIANVGAYAAPRCRSVPTRGFPVSITGVYRVGCNFARVRCVFSNSIMTNAYRGAGRPEGIYVIERLIDAAAAELGISPVDLRRRNLVSAADMPWDTGTGEIYDSGDFARNLDDAIERADVAGFGERRTISGVRGRRRGLGVSTYVKINGGVPDEAAGVSIDGAGMATLAIGSQSNGQGHETAYGQLVADGLGIPVGSVTLHQGDTAVFGTGQGTGGSSAISVGGVAVAQAVEGVVEQGKGIAAGLLQAGTGEIDFSEGAFSVRDTSRSVTLAEVARAALDAGKPLAARAHYHASAKTYANGCHICEVEIDPATGRIEIARYTVVDDIGRVLNPVLAEGQVHGGVAQGIGQALVENCVYDRETAQLLTGSFLDYCLPRADDLPSFTVAFNEIACTTNPLGVKGVGEAGTTGALPAVVGAVVDALSQYGIRHIDMPLTPERIWRAIREAGG
jgi:carbon-monoxide dehydrogenase large subunit